MIYIKGKFTGASAEAITKVGTTTIIAIIIGSNSVQQKLINWSKRILGKEALTQINTKIIKQALIPKLKLEIKPCKTK